MSDVQDLANLREAFALFDVDQNGEISVEELAEIMANHNFHPTRCSSWILVYIFISDKLIFSSFRDELQEMIKNVDKNCNGSVDLEVMSAIRDPVK